MMENHKKSCFSCNHQCFSICNDKSILFNVQSPHKCHYFYGHSNFHSPFPLKPPISFLFPLFNQLWIPLNNTTPDTGLRIEIDIHNIRCDDVFNKWIISLETVISFIQPNADDTFDTMSKHHRYNTENRLHIYFTLLFMFWDSSNPMDSNVQ